MMQKISLVVLRVGMGAVILWFALQQLIDPASWISYLPNWTASLPISQIGFVYVNGWFEVTFGILLIVGFYTRIAAFLLAVHLLGIVFTLGYNQIAVRDFGLTIALISLSLYGTSGWSVDEFFETKSNLNQKKITN